MIPVAMLQSLIIEYFGVNGNDHYDRQAEHKVQIYKENNIETLSLTEDSFQND